MASTAGRLATPSVLLLSRSHGDDDDGDVVVGLAAIAPGLDRLHEGVARAGRRVALGWSPSSFTQLVAHLDRVRVRVRVWARLRVRVGVRVWVRVRVRARARVGVRVRVRDRVRARVRVRVGVGVRVR